MRTKLPQLPHALLPCEGKELADLLTACRQEERDIENYHIKDAVLAKADLAGLNFHHCLLENCRLIDCAGERAAFVDAVFSQIGPCDLSNSSFGSGYFHRCEFISCKGLGTDFHHSAFKQILIEDSNFRYANLDESKLEYAEIKESDFSSAIISNCRLVDFHALNTRLDGVVFFRTALKGIDLSENQIEGISVSDSAYELRGAVISPWQAIELARIFGLVIKN